MISCRIIFVLCVACCDAVSASYFTERTPFATAHPGGDVSLSWELGDINFGSRFNLQLSIEPLFKCSWTRTSSIRCDMFEERSDLVTSPPRPKEGVAFKRDVREVGFILRNVTLDDAGVYQIDISFRGRKRRGNSTGLVYVFQKPSPPIITYLEGSNDVILVCNSSSNSRPSAPKNLVTMQYSWKVTGIKYGYVQKGNTFIVDAEEIRPGSVVACSAREENSSYTSDTSSAILVPLGSQSAESIVNKPAAGLGALLVLSVIITCIVVGYLWWSGTLKCSRTPDAQTNDSVNVTSRRILPEQNAHRDQGTVCDYDDMGPPDYIPVEDLQYEMLDSNSRSDQRGINPGLVYENM